MTATPNNRPMEIISFLDRAGWSDAETHPFAGDFSSRHYARLTKPSGETAILMDADADQKSDRFIQIAGILRKSGVSAPEIYAAAAERGLILLQDFGSRNVGSLLDAGTTALPFILKATDLLAELHAHIKTTPDWGFPIYDAEMFADQAGLFLDFYIPYALGRKSDDSERTAFAAAWIQALSALDSLPTSLLLRDFMPDNLMDLPNGSLGVLDFQDAGIGSLAYDIASLCEEVRRDGGMDLLSVAVERYCEKTSLPVSKDALMLGCSLLAAQRHVRILGIIARLAANGRQEKLVFMPRVKRCINNLLQIDELKPVRLWMEKTRAIAQDE